MKGKILLTSLVVGPLIVVGFGQHMPVTLANETEASTDDATELSAVSAENSAVSTGVFEGCPGSFWRGSPEDGVQGGRWLWNDVIDPEWSASGGEGANPNIWIYGFNTFFTPMPELAASTMMSLLNVEDDAEDYRKAASSLVAGYLNASWGMAYPYTADELAAKWDAAVRTGNFFDLHTELERANNAVGGCPVPTSAE
jgi:hypothetical protein